MPPRCNIVHEIGVEGGADIANERAPPLGQPELIAGLLDEIVDISLQNFTGVAPDCIGRASEAARELEP